VQGLPENDLHVNTAPPPAMTPAFLAMAARWVPPSARSLGFTRLVRCRIGRAPETCLSIMLASRQPMWVWWGLT
jgi:hypothetical protein